MGHLGAPFFLISRNCHRTVTIPEVNTCVINTQGDYYMKKITALLGALLISTVAVGADITGAGATFPFPIYAKWAEGYKKATGTGMNYQSIGSSGR